MKMKRAHGIGCALALVITVVGSPVRAQAEAGAHDSPSPYTGFTGREIKALSPEEVERYLDGQGMGYALAAELNGYPGPKHVLELADELELSAGQRTAVRASFDRMQSRARELGRRIVELEGRVDRSFGSGEVEPGSLREDLAALGALQADLRFTHLDAHLETKAILTAGQVARYAALRGYEEGDHAAGHAGHDHRHPR